MSWPLLKEKWSLLQEKKTKSGGWVRLDRISGYVNAHWTHNRFHDLFLVVLQIGHIEGQPDRKGVFPMSFVQILSDWHCDRQVWGFPRSTSSSPLASHQTMDSASLYSCCNPNKSQESKRKKKYTISKADSETWRVNRLKCVLLTNLAYQYYRSHGGPAC